MPLWHGVDLCRDLALGHACLLRRSVHVAYLLLWVVVGYVARAADASEAAGHMSAPTSTVSGSRRRCCRRFVGTGGARYLVERNARVYRREWLVLLSGILEPLFYLFSVGVGVSKLVGDVKLPGGEVVSTPRSSRRRCSRSAP